MMLLTLLLLAQSVPTEFRVKLNCQPQKGDTVECVGVRWSFTMSGTGTGNLNPIDPVVPKVPTPVTEIPRTAYPSVSIREDLQPIAYDWKTWRKEKTKAIALKAGESQKTEFGTVITRYTDENTIPGSSMIMHYYSNHAPLCGNKLVVSANGGGAYVYDISTKKIRQLNHQPELGMMAVRTTWWVNDGTCDTLLMASANMFQPLHQIWAYHPSNDTVEMVKDFSSTLASLPQAKDLYITIAWASPNGKRMVLAVEKASKDARAVVLMDESGVRSRSFTSIPENFKNQPGKNFKFAGVAGATKDGAYYFLQFNGSPSKANGPTSLSFVMPWNADANYQATAINGDTATFHGTLGFSTNTHITGWGDWDGEKWEPKYGEPLDGFGATNTKDNPWCRVPFSCMGGAPNWLYTFRVHDLTKTPGTVQGYPYRNTFAYGLSGVGGMHLSSTPDSKWIIGSTYQERAADDNYLSQAPFLNELFLVEDKGTAKFEFTENPPYVKIVDQPRIVRLAEMNTLPWSVDGYWGSPRCSVSMSGKEVVCSSTNYDSGRIDVWGISGYTK